MACLKYNEDYCTAYRPKDLQEQFHKLEFALQCWIHTINAVPEMKGDSQRSQSCEWKQPWALHPQPTLLRRELWRRRACRPRPECRRSALVSQSFLLKHTDTAWRSSPMPAWLFRKTENLEGRWHPRPTSAAIGGAESALPAPAKRAARCGPDTRACGAERSAKKKVWKRNLSPFWQLNGEEKPVFWLGQLKINSSATAWKRKLGVCVWSGAGM